MKRLARRMTAAFGAGCLGGLVNSIAFWLLGFYGVTLSLGIRLAPSLTSGWLSSRLVWGGIWGVLFLLPILKTRPIKRGLLFSLAPSAVQLLIIFPEYTAHGTLGMGLGALTPVLVLMLNALWGVSAAAWIRYLGE